jgi:hypothetical protein
MTRISIATATKPTVRKKVTAPESLNQAVGEKGTLIKRTTTVIIKVVTMVTI